MLHCPYELLRAPIERGTAGSVGIDENERDRVAVSIERVVRLRGNERGARFDTIVANDDVRAAMRKPDELHGMMRVSIRRTSRADVENEAWRENESSAP